MAKKNAKTQAQPEIDPRVQVARAEEEIARDTKKMSGAKFGVHSHPNSWRFFVASMHFSLAGEKLRDFDDRGRHWRTALAMAWEAESEAHEATCELANEIDSLRSRLERGLRDLSNGFTVNSLGVVQGAALDVDRRCAIVGKLNEIMRRNWYRAIKAGAPRELLSEIGQKRLDELSA